jgi:excisionase family DNA binding protein
VQPRDRFSTHRQLGEAFGATFVDWWLSPLHHNFTRNEVALIAYAEERCTRQLLSEYFHGAEFADLVAFAEALPFDVIDLAAQPAKPGPLHLLGAELLADELGIDQAKVRALVKRRAIPFRKLGRYIRFRSDEVDEIRRRIAALAAA